MVMETAVLLDNKQGSVTLAGILPTIQRLQFVDKIRLIRILAEELESNSPIFPFEQGKTYALPTPYNSFGAGDILMKTLTTSATDK